jgi:hypothetical protein
MTDPILFLELALCIAIIGLLLGYLRRLGKI